MQIPQQQLTGNYKVGLLLRKIKRWELTQKKLYIVGENVIVKEKLKENLFYSVWCYALET